MDLAKLDTVKGAERGAAMPVRHPGSNKVIDGMTIAVLGNDHPSIQAARKAIMDRRLNSGVAKGKLKLSADEMEADAINLLSQCVTGWEGIEESGAKLECTPENVRRVLTNYPWLREQVDDFIADRANFLGN